MEQDESFELFGSEVEEIPFKVFSDLFTFGRNKGMGKLTDNQQLVLERVATSISYSNIQKELGKSNVGSIQSAIKGGIKNLLDALQDIVWLYKNPQILDLLHTENYLEKHVK